MSTAPPRHYTAFRLVLIAAMAVVVLVVAVRVVADPPVLAALLDFLGLGR